MPPRTRLAAALCFLTAAGTAVYWALFFLAPDVVRLSGEACYLAFERSFRLADAWMALCMALAGAGLLARRPASLLFGLLGAGGLIHLGCMDVLYNLEHGAYAHASPDVAIEVAINLFSFAAGGWLIAWFWVHRRVL
jgi:hypothetical protein